MQESKPLKKLQAEIDKLEHKKNALVSRLINAQDHKIPLREGERFIAKYGCVAMILMPGVMDIGEGGLPRAHEWASDRGGYIPTRQEMEDIVDALILIDGNEYADYFATLYPGSQKTAYFLSHRIFNGRFDGTRSFVDTDCSFDDGIMAACGGQIRYSSSSFSKLEQLFTSAISVRFEVIW